MAWSDETSLGHETDKIKHLTTPYTGVGCGLDLGCGDRRIWPNSMGIDVFVSPLGAQIAGDITDLSIFADESFPWVFSSHALEDLSYPDDVLKCLRSAWRVLKTGGHLVLYLPDAEQYPHRGEPGCNPAHQWEPTYGLVCEAMQQVGSWDLVWFEKRAEDNEYSLIFSFLKL
jgi:predicted SAM-dependent methyltransferase